MPDTISELCDALDKLESRSSLQTKIEPALRKQIVQALINRSPPTFQDIFDHFKLDAQGVSYTAFYYWARKIKRHAALFEMTHTLAVQDDSAQLLPRVLAARMLDNALDDHVDVIVLRRLMETYRMACSIEAVKARLDLQRRAFDNRRDLEKIAETQDVLRLARLIARTQHHFDRKDTPKPDPPPSLSPNG